ncbi:hypothetical protein NMG60_11007774 [Bertholletia excelsa]
MASSSSSKARSLREIRSISLPCRSNPRTVRIGEELNKVKAWAAPSAPTSRTIRDGLSGLAVLYRCAEELLSLSATQQALFRHQNELWVDEFQDLFLSLLDICGNSRDFLAKINENGRELQSSRRRRKGDPSIEASIARYTSLGKKLKKETRKLILDLKQMETKIEPSQPQEQDHHVSSVVRALREVIAVSFFVLQSLLLFLTVPRARGWSVVSKLLHKGAVAYENQQENVNELERVDDALQALYRNNSSEGDKVKVAQDSLKSLEESVETIEIGLECLFRHLIKARASLLNMLSL